MTRLTEVAVLKRCTGGQAFRNLTVCLLGLVATYFAIQRSGRSHLTLHQRMELASSTDTTSSWDKFDYQKVEVPRQVFDLAAKYSHQQGWLYFRNLTVFYRQIIPPEHQTSFSVLLMHGRWYTSRTWVDLGTMNLIAGLGFRVVAIDLPGFGNTRIGRVGDRYTFVKELVSELSLNKPVIVTPSWSGYLVLAYTTLYWEQMTGLVAVSPVGWEVLKRNICVMEKSGTKTRIYKPLQAYLEKPIPKVGCIKVPTMVVYGEHDRSASGAHVSLLPNSCVAEIPNAKHSPYVDNPDLWHKLLYNFLMRLLYESQHGVTDS